MSKSIQGSGRRTLSPAERATALSVSLRGAMIDRLDQKAAERGVSRSNLVVEALADYLDREIAAWSKEKAVRQGRLEAQHRLYQRTARLRTR